MSAAVEARKERGRAIAELFRIEKRSGKWSVPSSRGRSRYSVDLDADRPTCTCEDFASQGEPCKHVYAAMEVAEGRVGKIDAKAVSASDRLRDGDVVLAKTAAPRPTYRQDWPAYNFAQTREKGHFRELMADLCRGITEQPRKPGAGRKPAMMRDLAFAAAFKVYSTVSGRRFQTDLDDAYDKGYLTRAVRYNTMLDGMDSPEMTPVLHALIIESSRPLAAIETSFAIDSSGFGTTRYERWYDAKYGEMGTKAVWMKCHLACGVQTNIVTAVEIGDADSSDISRFAPLLAGTARNFTVREVSADAIYSTYTNTEAVTDLGAAPFLAFKSNAVAGREGAFREMFHFYSLRREEFLNHYHKRSNVESTFSMMKAKFGADLRCRSETAMVNESLCKVLCHNICCVIQSHYELGIAVAFWGEDAMRTESDDATPIDAFVWLLSLAPPRRSTGGGASNSSRFTWLVFSRNAAGRSGLPPRESPFSIAPRLCEKRRSSYCLRPSRAAGS